MKLIYGQYNSGKSHKAISLIKDKKDTIYISLDKDKSVSRVLEDYKVENLSLSNCFLIDLEFAILGNTGDLSQFKPLYKTVVIDSLNFVRVLQEVNHKFNLKHIIKGLEYLHYTYDVDIIATYNILKMADKMKGDIESVFVDSEWELIETKFKKKQKSLSLSSKDGVVFFL